MANTLRFKRGLASGIPTALAGEPLFTTDTFDLYIGNGTTNTRFQKYIASGTTSQLLRGDGSLLTMPIVLTSPSNGQVLKFNGTNWVNDSDAGITGSGSAGQVAYFTGATTQAGSNNLFWDNTNARLGIGTNTPANTLDVTGTARITGATTINGNLSVIKNSGSPSIIGVTDGTNTTSTEAYFNATAGTTQGFVLSWGQSKSTYKILGAGDVSLYKSNTAGDVAIFNDGTSGNIKFAAGGVSTAQMTLTTGGLLLLGSTTSSGERLQVTGTAKITGATSITNTMTARQVIVDGANNSNISRINLTRTDASWGIYNETDFRIYYGSGNTTTPATQYFSLGSGTGLATFSNAVTIGGNLTVDTNTLFVDATNNRVGIGTATPDATLRVAGTVNATQAIFGNVDGRGLLIATSSIAGTNDAGTILNARGASSGTFIFQTDGTQRVQIDSTGLIINGGNALEFINSAANPVSAIRPTGGGTSVMSTNSNGLHIAVGTEAAGDLILASNNTERVRLSSNGWFSHASATNPSSSVTDSYVQYSADVTAGNAAPHFRTENGAVIKLYQETTSVGNAIFSQGGGNAVLDDSTFAGYTIRQVVQALRNQGILQ